MVWVRGQILGGKVQVLFVECSEAASRAPCEDRQACLNITAGWEHRTQSRDTKRLCSQGVSPAGNAVLFVHLSVYNSFDTDASV
jgi:hypothetical protein